MNTIREIKSINERELELGIAGTPASWHSQYSKSAWVAVGRLASELTEGDVICVMSQYGEIEDITLLRDAATGESRGTAFVKYEDARSCILAVDNLIGIELVGRSLTVSHVDEYKLPGELQKKSSSEDLDRVAPGHAYMGEELANDYCLDRGQDLFAVGNGKEKKTSTSRHKRDKKESKRRERDEKKRSRKRKKAHGSFDGDNHIIPPTDSEEDYDDSDSRRGHKKRKRKHKGAKKHRRKKEDREGS